MKIDADISLRAYIGDKPLRALSENEFALDLTRAEQITLRAPQSCGKYDTAIFNSPITFEVGDGIYDLGREFDDQGLDFYSGGIRLKKTIDISVSQSRTFFEADDTLSCAMELAVNGKRAGVMLTQPYRLDITDLVHDGKNEIEVLSYNTLHNHMKTIPTNYNAPIKRATRPTVKA